MIRLKYKLNKLRAHFQRFKRGYAYTDVWNMDCWFIETIRPMLIHLRDNSVGCPYLCEDLDENERRWKDILTQMIVYLENMDEDNLIKDYESVGLCVDNERIYKAMNENKDKFFELFSKYFWCLWD